MDYRGNNLSPLFNVHLSTLTELIKNMRITKRFLEEQQFMLALSNFFAAIIINFDLSHKRSLCVTYYFNFFVFYCNYIDVINIISFIPNIISSKINNTKNKKIVIIFIGSFCIPTTELLILITFRYNHFFTLYFKRY